MNEWVFAVLTVVNVISLGLIFVMYHSIMTMKLHIAQAHTGLATILGKVLGVEMALTRVSNGFAELINNTGDLLDRMDGPPNALYKTTDGKYVATSIDELISKMKSDKKDSEYFSDDEVDKLRKLFEPDEDDDSDEPEDKY